MIRVLVVEDDSGIRRWIETTLSRAGYTVTAASTVAQARSLLKPGMHDLLVTDWKLPDGSGASLAREAKATGVATLVITGYGLSLPAGAFDEYSCLWKPFDAQGLLRAVEHQISLRSAGAQQQATPRAWP